jgi:RNA polymerase sigma factor (sigma-70 family)
MNPQDSDHIRHRFDSYCKKILKYTARDYYTRQKWRGEREVSFSELTERELASLAASDKYFTDERIFEADGESIGVSDGELAEALSTLPVDRRNIILLAYFLDMTDKEIAERLNLVRRTVAYRRTSTLRVLKKIMEGKADDRKRNEHQGE